MCITIYHNPMWGKSRKTLQLLRGNGINPTIIEYIKNPPNVEELRKICNILGLEPSDIIRKGDKVYKELNISNLGEDIDLYDIIIKHPKLMERPIVIKGQKGIIGRPPEKVEELL